MTLVTDHSDFYVRMMAMLEAATLGPWAEDDGHVFSCPLEDERSTAILRKIEKLPYDQAALDPTPIQVATTQQQHECSDADARLIVAMRNMLPALCIAIELAAFLEKESVALDEMLEEHGLAGAPATIDWRFALQNLRAALSDLSKDARALLPAAPTPKEAP